MSDSLRDQLLGLGFKPAPKPERPAQQKSGKPSGPGGQAPRPDAGRNTKPAARKPPHGHARHGQARHGQAPQGPAPQRQGQGKPRTREDIDLAKAYAIRAQREKDERIAAEAAKQEEARLRREARAKLAELVKDKALNDPAADIARHFPYGGKIKRIYVTEVQLKALNAGELGVLQMDGRYLLVDAALLAEAEAVFAPSIALKVDPNAPAGDDPYADPKYQVPDDLVW
ncbi:uncharacterized protein YaiL (DUF2058 family) [Lysobacter niastensis]|uniref:Uncharacterized protein YaiL (DUF2058 family) n=1 Tax=Lysobacter niastensis TaxID=380629 RepID=A0ABU1WA10_9GAMM|nr:DUF2058 family protein [Lysobacter niastensis]MDR7134474.1 uncharacterized protein YaiL (DUF2058 family) [Lysobacter niastensis]